MRIFPSIVLGLALAGCGPKALPHENKSVSELMRMLNDREPRVQAQGALGLSLHGPAAREALPRLMELLGSNDVRVRQQAALALGSFGPEARPAIESLEKTLADGDWSVRRQAALSLGGIGDPKAKPALEKLKRDPNKLVRQAASDALAKLNPEGRR